MVVEIPKGQQAKLEINKAEPLNPIKQDIKVSGYIILLFLNVSRMESSVMLLISIPSTMVLFPKLGKIQSLFILTLKQKVSYIR